MSLILNSIEIHRKSDLKLSQFNTYKIPEYVTITMDKSIESLIEDLTNQINRYHLPGYIISIVERENIYHRRKLVYRIDLKRYADILININAKGTITLELLRKGFKQRKNKIFLNFTNTENNKQEKVSLYDYYTLSKLSAPKESIENNNGYMYKSDWFDNLYNIIRDVAVYTTIDFTFDPAIKIVRKLIT